MLAQIFIQQECMLLDADKVKLQLDITNSTEDQHILIHTHLTTSLATVGLTIVASQQALTLSISKPLGLLMILEIIQYQYILLIESQSLILMDIPAMNLLKIFNFLYTRQDRMLIHSLL